MQRLTDDHKIVFYAHKHGLNLRLKPQDREQIQLANREAVSQIQASRNIASLAARSIDEKNIAPRYGNACDGHTAM